MHFCPIARMLFVTSSLSTVYRPKNMSAFDFNECLERSLPPPAKHVKTTAA